MCAHRSARSCFEMKRPILDAIPEIKDISRPPRALVDALVKIGPATLSSELSRQLGIRDPQIRVPRLPVKGCLPPELKIFHAEPFIAVDGKEPSLSACRRSSAPSASARRRNRGRGRSRARRSA
jgi:hypothetical protein